MFNLFCPEISARSKNCKKRLHKPVGNDDPKHFILKGEHLHAGDSRKIGKKKVMTKLKDLAKNTKEPSREIISKSVADSTKATRAKLPTEKVMSRMISSYRRKPGVLKNPQSLSELILQGEYRETVVKLPFLLYDLMDSLEIEEIENNVRHRTLIFATQENLKFLSLCDEYFMDGTFSVTPALFTQLYTIHGKYLSNILFFYKLH